MALRNGVDVKTVSSMLGHYSAGFMLDTCAHVTTDTQFKAAQTMGNISYPVRYNPFCYSLPLESAHGQKRTD